jgi:hypothetical protein
LVDAHWAVPIGDRVQTEIEADTGAMAKHGPVVGADGMAAALRVRDRLTGEPTGPRDIHMCHGFCELSALRLDPCPRRCAAFS